MCYRQNRKPVSVLTCHLSTRSTPRKRAGSPFVPWDSPVYMIFLVLVPSPPHVAIRRRELLPRGFTLTLSGGLFSVTAFIRLLPSVLSTAGCPFQSGLSSEARFRGKYLPPPLCGCPEGHAVFTLFRPATCCPYVFEEDTDPVATAYAVLVQISVLKQ